MLQSGRLQQSLDALHSSMGLSSDLEDTSGDADVLGAIGDTYTELGELEKAAEASPLLLIMLPWETRQRSRPAPSVTLTRVLWALTTTCTCPLLQSWWVSTMARHGSESHSGLASTFHARRQHLVYGLIKRSADLRQSDTD